MFLNDDLMEFNMDIKPKISENNNHNKPRQVCHFFVPKRRSQFKPNDDKFIVNNYNTASPDYNPSNNILDDFFEPPHLPSDKITKSVRDLYLVEDNDYLNTPNVRTRGSFSNSSDYSRNTDECKTFSGAGSKYGQYYERAKSPYNDQISSSSCTFFTANSSLTKTEPELSSYSDTHESQEYISTDFSMTCTSNYSANDCFEDVVKDEKEIIFQEPYVLLEKLQFDNYGKRKRLSVEKSIILNHSPNDVRKCLRSANEMMMRRVNRQRESDEETVMATDSRVEFFEIKSKKNEPLISNSIVSQSGFIDAIKHRNESLKNTDTLYLMQPIILIQKLQLHINNEYVSNNILNNCTYGSRVLESDEETIPAIDDKIPKKKLSKCYLSEKLPFMLDVKTSRTFNDLIYCFKCRIHSKRFCVKHPVTKIFNLNISCPFLEYSTSQIINNSIKIRDCACMRNQIYHMKQSIPYQFRLRKSKHSEIGIWTTCSVVQGTIIGPYLGVIGDNCNIERFSRMSSKNLRISKRTDFSLRIEFAYKSNWLRCINFTRNHDEGNLKILFHNQKVYFQVIKDLISNQQLLVLHKVRAPVRQ